MAAELPKGVDVFYSVSAGPLQSDATASYYSEIVIRDDFSTVDFFWNRPGADRAGVPVGKFSSPLEQDIAGRIKNELTKLSGVGAPVGSRGYIGQPQFRLISQFPAVKLDLQFVLSDTNIVSSSEELRDSLNSLLFQLMRRPVASLKAKLTQVRDHFVLTLGNEGTQAVCIADPVMGLHDGDERAVFVRIAKRHADVPGMVSPPLRWSHLSLEGREETRLPKTLEVAGGGSVSFRTEAWAHEPNASGYIAQGVFIDYLGADTDRDGCFAFRGGVFSNNLLLSS